MICHIILVSIIITIYIQESSPPLQLYNSLFSLQFCSTYALVPWKGQAIYTLLDPDAAKKSNSFGKTRCQTGEKHPDTS